MTRLCFLLLPAVLLCDCRQKQVVIRPAPAKVVVAAPVDVPAPPSLNLSVVRVNSTQQGWSESQPWEKSPPDQRRALAAIVAKERVLTTSELVAESTYVEFESPDGTRFAEAKVIAIDYEANLALLGPADETEGHAFFDGTRPMEISMPQKIGQSLGILQVEENGLSLLTPGNLRSVDVTSHFLPEHAFLTYLVKASMQSAASSYSLPVLNGRKLAGILLSYDSKDQICDVVAAEIIDRFLRASAEGNYQGFPSLGISVARTEDVSFRQWLKLPTDVGGLYIRTIRKNGAAEKAGVHKGDVLVAIDGHKIDRRGYYDHEVYGSLFWGHLIRGQKAAGETVALSLLRDGKPMEVTATLLREEEGSKLVPGYLFGKAPNFLVKGGLVFQELSRPLLEAYGKNWETRAPLNLLDAFENPEKFEDKMDRVVFLSGSIPTPATVGYEGLRNLIVKKVNDKPVKDMKSLIEAFNSGTGELHSIEFLDEDFKVYLDDSVTTAVDTQLMERGINPMSRAN